MANWAMTDYAIEGPKEILEKINDAILHHETSEGASEHWEGDILKALGIEWTDDRYLRGFIYDGPWWDNDEHTSLRFQAEEAWDVTDFHEVLEETYPEIKIYWNCEEPDNEVYMTNDKEGKYFSERYYVDICIHDDYWSDYFKTEETAYKYVEEVTGCKNEEDVEKFNEEHEDTDEYINIHEYKIVE